MRRLLPKVAILALLILVLDTSAATPTSPRHLQTTQGPCSEKPFDSDLSAGDATKLYSRWDGTWSGFDCDGAPINC